MRLPLSRSARHGRVTGVRQTLAFACLAVGLAACSGGGGGGSASNSTPPVTATPPPVTSNPPPATYSAKASVAQKGPLAQGSTVTVQELDATLAPTGKQYSYSVTSDLGAFSPNAAFASQYVAASATGSYFDEVANTVS